MKKEIYIALVAIVGIAVLFFGMNFLKGLPMFDTDDDYVIEFEDINGLSTSTPIYANGFQIGVVKGIDYDYTHQQPIRVHIGVDKAMRIPEGSSAEISSDMMGNLKCTIVLGPDMSSCILPGASIKGSEAGGALAQAAALVPTVQQMLPKLDSILTSLNTLMADPAVVHSLHNVEGITANLQTTTQQMNTLMAGINSRLPQMLDKTGEVIENTNTLTHQLAGLDVETTMRKVDATMANVQSITDKLNSPTGSFGLMMNDASLYNHLSATAASADRLLIDLQQHPKRYVHFSLFGKKDK